MDTHEHDTIDHSKVETHVCADCGGDFQLTAGERDFYLGKGLQLPRRCFACRKDRRKYPARVPTQGYWR